MNGIRLNAIGLSLSGADDLESRRKIQEEIDKDNLCENEVFVSCDTVGSVASVVGLNKGVVLIAGTGSNCELIDPNNDNIRCGGWGHFIGDEASGFWIANKVVKTIFDHTDGLRPSVHPIDKSWDAVKTFFSVQDKMEMLKHFYSNFEKSFYASFCKEVSDLANNGDELCKEVFKEAGRQLALHVIAVTSRSSEKIQEIQVICVGSVFHSWNLLKEGFEEVLKREGLTSVTLLRPTVNACIGAAILGANKAGIEWSPKLDANSQVLYEYRKT